MTTRDNSINLTSSAAPEKNAVPSDDDVLAYVRRQVQVLDRHHSRFTITADEGTPLSERLKNIHYEWHPDDPETHYRLTQQGFKVDDELGALSKFSHTDGAGSPRIGDVRCYSIPKKYYDALQKLERAKAAEKTDPDRASQDLAAKIQASGIAGLEMDKAENKVSRVSGTELQTILNQG